MALSIGITSKKWLQESTRKLINKGKYNRAQGWVNALDEDFLDIAHQAQINEKKFYSQVTDYFFSSKYPFITTVNQMQRYYDDLVAAKRLVGSIDSDEYTRRCDQLTAKANDLLHVLKKAITTLKRSAQWTDELQVQEAEKARKAQESMAVAQHQIAYQAQVANAETRKENQRKEWNSYFNRK